MKKIQMKKKLIIKMRINKGENNEECDEKKMKNNLIEINLYFYFKYKVLIFLII